MKLPKYSQIQTVKHSFNKLIRHWPIYPFTNQIKSMTHSQTQTMTITNTHSQIKSMTHSFNENDTNSNSKRGNSIPGPTHKWQISQSKSIDISQPMTTPHKSLKTRRKTINFAIKYYAWDNGYLTLTDNTNDNELWNEKCKVYWQC